MGDGRLLIVNADDFGLTAGVSDGILRAAEAGVVTSTSVLAVAPAFTSRIAALRDSALGVGCHLALVGEDPLLLSPSEIPTLVDHRGQPPLSWRHFLRRAMTGRINPEDVRRECSAQIEAVAATGCAIDHLDTHQHLHLWPAVAGVMVEVAVEFGVSAVRLPAAAGGGPKGWGIRYLGGRLRARLGAAQICAPEGFAGLDGAGHLGRAGMISAVELLDRSGVSTAELGVHPGQNPDLERSRYVWGYDWAGELEALCSAELRSAIGAAGFTLGRFADLSN